MHTQEKSVSSPHSNRSDLLCHQLSRILFFSNLFQHNYLSLLRTSRCGILLNQRITAFQRHYSFCLSPHWFLTEGSPCQNPRINPCFPLRRSLTWNFGLLLLAAETLQHIFVLGFHNHSLE